MTTVEGGMICTNDEDFYKLNILKRSHGLARELPERYHKEIRVKYPDIDFQFLFLTDGFNFRNTEFNAFLGLTQLHKLDSFIEIRNDNYRRFHEICMRYPESLISLHRPGMSSFVLPFVFKEELRKKEFQALIRAKGIESRPLISGNLLKQPFLTKYYVAGEFEVADMIHQKAFYIGNNQFVNEDRIDLLEKVMHEYFK